MARVIPTTVYTFAELSDDAKEVARNWYRECIDSDELADRDDWCAIAAILGITFDTRAVKLMGGGTRHDPCIWWQLGYSQGDYANFDGRYAYAKGAAKRIREYAPTDKTLHAIADDLQAAQRREFYRLEARAKSEHRGGMSVDVWRSDDVECDAGDVAVREALRDFASWIYDQVRAQNDYLTSDETVDESITLNAYEFHEDGSIA